MENKAKEVKKKNSRSFLKILAGVVLIYFGLLLFGNFFDKFNPIRSEKIGRPQASFGMTEEMIEPINPMVGDPMMIESDEMVMPAVDHKTAPSQKGVKIPKRIIKNGFMEIEVEDVKVGMDKVVTIATQNGGDVFNSNINRLKNGSLRGSLMIKVPNHSFEATMKMIRNIEGVLISESVNTSDVTREFVDLQARLENKKAEEVELRKLLERSGELKNVLEVTKEISRVRGEIERLEGQLRYMENQTDMSVINVTFVETTKASPGQNSWRPGQVLNKSLHDLFLGMQNLAYGLIRFFVVDLPFLILISLIIFGFYKGVVIVYRKMKK